jgi:hypothetical protein
MEPGILEFIASGNVTLITIYPGWNRGYWILMPPAFIISYSYLPRMETELLEFNTSRFYFSNFKPWSG